MQNVDDEWRDWSVAKCWPMVKHLPNVVDYFPDNMEKGRIVDKRFFWGVMFFIAP